MSNSTTIGYDSPLRDLITEKKNLRGYIRWGKRQLDRHIKTGQPITTRNRGIVTVYGYFGLEKDLGEAIQELFAIENIIRLKTKIKRRTKNVQEKI